MVEIRLESYSPVRRKMRCHTPRNTSIPAKLSMLNRMATRSSAPRMEQRQVREHHGRDKGDKAHHQVDDLEEIEQKLPFKRVHPSVTILP